MIPNNYKDLIENLKIKTIEKKAAWQKTSTSDEFMLKLTEVSITIKYTKGYASFVVNSGENMTNVTISLYNDNGQKIDSVEIEKNDAGFLKAFELYEAIRRSYYNIDSVMNNVLSEIKTKDFIGEDDLL